ncbi:MAG: methyltransferase domain-containing protein [Chloroflexi bacterium]|nr:methyltransferase domain-containing protein [Chloroflexota bacterium]
MRKELVGDLCCPITRESLTLQVLKETDQEVTWGLLTSASGQHKYTIIDGVAELLPPLDKQTQTERLARENLRYHWEAERQRPYLNDHPNPSKWPSRAANAEQGLAQVRLENSFVLDLGASTAWSTRMIAQRHARAIALDLSTSALRDAEAQFATGVYFDRVAATMTRLPFVDSRFDVVFSSASVHHADDLHTAFSEISRVLKPGGCAVLTSEPVLGKAGSSEQFGRAAKDAGMNEHIYPLAEYRRAARASGLRPKVLFPADLELQLNGTIPAPVLTGRFRSVWRWTPPLLRRLSLEPAHWLLGLSLTMIASKP